MRGKVEMMAIGCRVDARAGQPHCCGREDAVLAPGHCLSLIEQKINALDQVTPLAEWESPPDFATLRRLMEARMLKLRRREYAQVLRLPERHRPGGG